MSRAGLRPSSELSAAVRAIRDCERPLLIAGGGVHYSDALPELAELSARCGIPVAETSAGKGALPDGELAVGGVGVTGTRAANALAREADLVVCVGTRLIDLTTGSHSLFQDPDVRFVGLNLVSRDAHKLGALPLVADAKLGLRALLEALGCRGLAGARGVARARARGEGSLGASAERRPRPSRRRAHEPGPAASRPERGLDARTDWLVVASGTPHVDVHKLWDASTGARCLMEVGFSCMAGEIPTALGVRMARPDAGEVYVLIGDGNYLMGASGELVTARQEGLKLTVIVVENHGFQSIHGLQRARTGRSFGLEFRERSADGSGVSGPIVEVDYAANARSLGCAVFTAASLDEFRAAARRGPGRDGARGDRRARGAAAAAARLRLLVGRRGGRALRAARDARAGGRACPRPRASAALPPTPVRIVATAEVPPVAREAFARLGEIEVAAAGDCHAIAGAEVLIVRGTRLDAATARASGPPAGDREDGRRDTTTSTSRQPPGWGCPSCTRPGSAAARWPRGRWP